MSKMWKLLVRHGDGVTHSLLPSPTKYLDAAKSRTSVRWFVNGGPDGKSSRSSVITYLTDVEGDAAYLDRYVKNSRILQFVPNNPRWNEDRATCTPPLDDHFSSCHYFPYNHCIDFCGTISDQEEKTPMLIYGGDVWDKGGSDLYVIRQLLDLKRRHPQRVHFILGNRDIHKMRISQELGLYGQNGEAPTLPKLPDPVFWIRNWHVRKGGNPHQTETLLPTSNGAADRLRWILARTMGSPKAFELRRLELQREKRALESPHNPSPPSTAIVTDEEVVESYRRTCHPSTGEMGNYLANANVVLHMGELLVLHGALPLTGPVLREAVDKQQEPSEFWKDLSFARPWEGNEHPMPSGGNAAAITARNSIHEWMDSLNQFAQRSLESWRESFSSSHNGEDGRIWALHGGYPADMPCGQLMQYGMGSTPDGKRNPTVVYASWSVDGMPRRFYPDHPDRGPRDQMYARLVQEFFRQSQVRIILVGHQPQGDMPLPIRIHNDDDDASGQAALGWVLCCDTSYSGDTRWYNPEVSEGGKRVRRMKRGAGSGFRGDAAVSEVLVELDPKGRISEIYWHGVLSDGTQYESRKLPLSTDDIDQPFVVGTLAHGDGVPDKEETPDQTMWWTKAQIGETSALITTAKGYDVTNYILKHAKK